MSSSHNTTHWLDTWWPLLLILFGLTFITFIDTFSPYSEDNPHSETVPGITASQH